MQIPGHHFRLSDSDPVQVESGNLHFQINASGTSLVVQWLRICLPTQGTWERGREPRSLERGATRPARSATTEPACGKEKSPEPLLRSNTAKDK